MGVTGGIGGYGGWWTGMPYGFLQNQQELPYYAKYPPVYYSYPVARTYGYSPFAYPPGYATPDMQPAPAEIINPYVPQSDVKPTANQTVGGNPTPKPLTVLNPFVGQQWVWQADAKSETPALRTDPPASRGGRTADRRAYDR